MDIPLEAETGDGEDTSFVDEADEILSIVSSVVTSEGVSAEAHYDRWKAIVRNESIHAINYHESMSLDSFPSPC